MLIFELDIGLRVTGSSDAVEDPDRSHITILREIFTKPLPRTERLIIRPSPPLPHPPVIHPREEAQLPIVSPSLMALSDWTPSTSP